MQSTNQIPVGSDDLNELNMARAVRAILAGRGDLPDTAVLAKIKETLESSVAVSGLGNHADDPFTPHGGMRLDSPDAANKEANKSPRLSLGDVAYGQHLSEVAGVHADLGAPPLAKPPSPAGRDSPSCPPVLSTDRPNGFYAQQRQYARTPTPPPSPVAAAAVTPLAPIQPTRATSETTSAAAQLLASLAGVASTTSVLPTIDGAAPATAPAASARPARPLQVRKPCAVKATIPDAPAPTPGIGNAIIEELDDSGDEPAAEPVAVVILKATPVATGDAPNATVVSVETESAQFINGFHANDWGVAAAHNAKAHKNAMTSDAPRGKGKGGGRAGKSGGRGGNGGGRGGNGGGRASPIPAPPASPVKKETRHEREARKKSEKQARLLKDRMGDIPEKFDEDRIAADKYDSIFAWLVAHNDWLGIPEHVFNVLRTLDGRHGNGIWDCMLSSVWLNPDPTQFTLVVARIRDMAGGRTRGSAPIPDDCKLHAGLVDNGWAVVARKERERVDPATGLMRAAPRKPKPAEYFEEGHPRAGEPIPRCHFVTTSPEQWVKELEKGTISYSPDFNAVRLAKEITLEERNEKGFASAISLDSSDESDAGLDQGTIQSNHAAAVAAATAAVSDVHLSLSDDESEDGVEDEVVPDGVEDMPAAVAAATAAVSDVHLSLSDDESEDGVEDEVVPDGVEDMPAAARQVSTGSVVSVEAVPVDAIPAV